MGELVVLLNAKAGSGKAARPEAVEQAFAEAGAACRVYAVKGEDLPALARQAASERPRAVVAGGGDGTVSAVASALAGGDVPLAVLPLGTLNHFAKDLGLPLDLPAAVANAVTGRTAAVDVCDVNGRVFVNNSSLGLYPLVVRQRETRQRLGIGKWPAFLWAIGTGLRRYPFLDLRLAAGGKSVARRTPFVFVGNNVYAMEGLRIGSRASLCGGEMCVYTMRGGGRLALLRLVLHALAGRLSRERNFETLRATELWIETRRRRIAVAIDGEALTMHSPLHYRIRPAALKVLVP